MYNTSLLMRTEAIRRFTSGFELNEQELRRIHDVCDQQMKRALPNGDYHSLFSVQFKNGAISDFVDFNQVFEGENWGSTAVVSVGLHFRQNSDEASDSPKNAITLTFSDTIVTNKRSP